MKEETVVVAEKKVVWIVYTVLLLAAVFALGWFAGNGDVASQVQVTVLEAPQASVSQDALFAAETSRETTGYVDLNTADQLTLETLPGIGPELASRILAYRQSVGAFVTKEQIMDVEGIGEKRYADIEQLITVGGTP